MQGGDKMIYIFAFQAFGVQMFGDEFRHMIFAASRPTVERQNCRKENERRWAPTIWVRKEEIKGMT